MLGQRRHAIAIRAVLVAAIVGAGAPLASAAAAEVVDPTLTAYISSATPASAAGWYRTPVTVWFSCLAGSAPLQSPCPGPVTISEEGPGLYLATSILATDGGSATVAVSVNIDQQVPTLRVTGAKHGHTYRTVRTLHCNTFDTLSGVAGCAITQHRHHTRHNGVFVNWVATATDNAGNATSKVGSYWAES